MMTAVTPTANSGSISFVRKNFAFHWNKTVVLALMFAGTTCYSFRVLSSQRSRVKSFISKRKTHNIVRSIDTSALKASVVDQEKGPGSFLDDCNGIETDWAEAPMKNIDQIEEWYLSRLEEYYAYSERHIKCPFFRRRCGDILDDIEGFVRFFLIRPYFQESSSLGPPLSCRSLARNRRKAKHLTVNEILEILRKDWRATRLRADSDDLEKTTIEEKGYYITGRMSTQIYRDDCEFHSPDPDLPLKGLRKYIGVASHLFDSKVSYSKLLSLERVRNGVESASSENAVLKAKWKISLTINLPWKPKLTEFSGSTLYFLDDEHLIFRHQESWDILVWDAFLETLPTSKKHSNNTSLCPLAILSSLKSEIAYSSSISPPRMLQETAMNTKSTSVPQPNINLPSFPR